MTREILYSVFNEDSSRHIKWMRMNEGGRRKRVRINEQGCEGPAARWLIDKGGAKEYSSASGTKSSNTQQRPFPSRMKQELVQPHAYVALRLPSDSTIVVQVLQNTYVK